MGALDDRAASPHAASPGVSPVGGIELHFLLRTGTRLGTDARCRAIAGSGRALSLHAVREVDGARAAAGTTVAIAASEAAAMRDFFIVGRKLRTDLDSPPRLQWSAQNAASRRRFYGGGMFVLYLCP